MPNIHEPATGRSDGRRVERLAQKAGADRLGLSLYELEPGQSMVYHYHLGREELLIALAGRIVLRTPEGSRELREGDVVALPRGERGAHGFTNGGEGIARVLVFSEQRA